MQLVNYNNAETWYSVKLNNKFPGKFTENQNCLYSQLHSQIEFTANDTEIAKHLVQNEFANVFHRNPFEREFIFMDFVNPLSAKCLSN